MWQRLYGHDGKGVPKFRVKDRVRISKFKRQFQKGYMANRSEEIDDLGEVLDGTFYEPELQMVSFPTDKLYRVESVLQRRKVGRRTDALVKWYGYPTKFSSWIEAKTLVSYIDYSHACRHVIRTMTDKSLTEVYTTTIEEEEQQDTEDSTDAQTDDANVPWHNIFSTACPKRRSSFYAGRHIVNHHLDKYIQPNDRSQEL